MQSLKQGFDLCLLSEETDKREILYICFSHISKLLPFGRTSQILVGTRLLSETLYKDAYAALVSRLNYGNGIYKTYEYDNRGRLTSEGINGVTTRSYLYDKQSNIAQIQDFITNVVTKFQYDMIGRTIRIKSSDGQAMDFVYDTYNRLALSKWSKAGRGREKYEKR